MKLRIHIFLLIFSGIFFLQNCKPNKPVKSRVVYVNSYHLGHPSSDEIMDAVIKEFSPDSFELVTFIMDTKRNSSKDYIENRALQIYDSIQIIHPDIIIVSDDNAVKYLVQPFFPKSEIPVVFCGVNWSAKEYNLKEVKITGMLEILPLGDVLQAMKSIDPSIEKLLVLNENTTTSRKEMRILDTLFNRVGVFAEHQLVDDFEHWKEKFKVGNELYDLIYISTNGAIKNWDNEEAVKFVMENIKVPIVTCEDFMMPYAVVGMTKIAKEQGIWAATTAKRILNGKHPSEIPITSNREKAIWLNKGLAEKINFQPDTSFLGKAKVLD